MDIDIIWLKKCKLSSFNQNFTFILENDGESLEKIDIMCFNYNPPPLKKKNNHDVPVIWQRYKNEIMIYFFGFAQTGPNNNIAIIKHISMVL